jgi:hypothetical protein
VKDQKQVQGKLAKRSLWDEKKNNPTPRSNHLKLLGSQPSHNIAHQRRPEQRHKYA